MKKQKSAPDIAGMILQVQQQLSFLDKKIDALIGQSAARPFTAERPKPFQPERRPGNNYSQRVLHKAICADCNKECEVPFKPSHDRPVYCKDCFAKRKSGNAGSAEAFKTNVDNKPREEKPFYAKHVDKLHGVEKKRPSVKKRPAVKRRKARG